MMAWFAVLMQNKGRSIGSHRVHGQFSFRGAAVVLPGVVGRARVVPE